MILSKTAHCRFCKPSLAIIARSSMSAALSTWTTTAHPACSHTPARATHLHTHIQNQKTACLEPRTISGRNLSASAAVVLLPKPKSNETTKQAGAHHSSQSSLLGPLSNTKSSIQSISNSGDQSYAASADMNSNTRSGRRRSHSRQDHDMQSDLDQQQRSEMPSHEHQEQAEAQNSLTEADSDNQNDSSSQVTTIKSNNTIAAPTAQVDAPKQPSEHSPSMPTTSKRKEKHGTIRFVPLSESHHESTSTSVAGSNTNASMIVGLLPPKSLQDAEINAASTSTICGGVMDLSQEQRNVLDLVQKGHHVYFTGKAGSGKTELIRQTVSALRKSGKRVSVTAPTGIAASLIGGRTLHAFTSLPPRFESMDYDVLVKYIRGSRRRLNEYTNTDVWILDEASMVHPTSFRILDTLFRQLRMRPDVAFGGMQLVICGDFFQLPPVDTGAEANNIGSNPTDELRIQEHLEELTLAASQSRIAALLYERKQSGTLSHRWAAAERIIKECNDPSQSGYISHVDHHTKYLFDSSSWKALRRDGLKECELSQSFRQRDPEFVALLDDVRLGICSPELWALLDPWRVSRGWQWDDTPSNISTSSFSAALHGDGTVRDKIQPTVLSSYRERAERKNWDELMKLGSPLQVYDAVDFVDVQPQSAVSSDPNDLLSMFDDQSVTNANPTASASNRVVLYGEFGAEPTTTTNYALVRDRMKSDTDWCQAGRTLPLCVGAQVVLLRNIDVKLGLANGTRGVVVDFIDSYDSLHSKKMKLPVVDFVCNGASESNGDESGESNELKPWVEARRQYVVGFHEFSAPLQDVTGNTDVNISDLLRSVSGDKAASSMSGNSGADAPISSASVMRRWQLPLKHAWALTIHKAQGMTLDCVELDVGRSFAPGQGYVALSRVRSLEGLRIRNFEEHSVMVSGRVAKKFGVGKK